MSVKYNGKINLLHVNHVDMGSGRDYASAFAQKVKHSNFHLIIFFLKYELLFKEHVLLWIRTFHCALEEKEKLEGKTGDVHNAEHGKREHSFSFKTMVIDCAEYGDFSVCVCRLYT